MAVLTSAGITFGDATSQTTAATAAALVTTANVLSATAGASVGAVGTYALLGNTSNTITATGTTYAGSSLRYAGLAKQAGNAALSYWNGGSVVGIVGVNTNLSGTPSGTWRAMGYGWGGVITGCDTDYYSSATLYLRIS